MILFYSGTGNSEHVARRLSAALNEDLHKLFYEFREESVSKLHSDTPWVICTPTYAWQLPHIVKDWFRRAEFSGCRDVYFVLTCGDGVGAAGKYARKLCEEKGLAFKGLAKVIMPENYIAMFNAPEEAEAKEIVRKADEVVDSIAAQIAAGKELPEEKKFGGAFLSSAVNAGFYKFSISDKQFTVSDACIACCLCEKLCPLENIHLSSGRPVWLGNCTHCMACICHCPAHAIEYGKKSAGKPRYTCPDL